MPAPASGGQATGFGRLQHLMVLSLAVLAAACSVPARKPAVPHADIETATVLGGLPNARFWADTQVPELAEEAVRAVDRERRHLGLGPSERLPPVNLLAVSGGGDNGAFGAGLLNGWTAAGTGRNSRSSPASAPAR